MTLAPSNWTWSTATKPYSHVFLPKLVCRLSVVYFIFHAFISCIHFLLCSAIAAYIPDDVKLNSGDA